MALIDKYGRVHDYLRVSVTDRCNLRCIYCMGPEGVPYIPHQEILTYEQILEVVRAAVDLGVTKIRVTGGEPLVRKGVLYLVEQIAGLPGVQDLSMTTNGVLLSRYAGDLKAAGLHRVNISLDSLNPKVFRRITRTGNLQEVLAGIDAALAAGLGPVKINTVLMKGLNHEEVVHFIKLALEQPLHVRFIEYMPIGDHDRSYRERYLPLEHVLHEAENAGLGLLPVNGPRSAGPAEYYAVPGGKGTIGLIHPVSNHFCAGCNRLRLTAEGQLKACLYWQNEYPVRTALGNPDAIKLLLRTVVDNKPQAHRMAAACRAPSVQNVVRGMSKTGG